MTLRTADGPHLLVLGIGAEGWAGLTCSQREELLQADVVLGGARHLAMLPDVEGQRREPWPSPLREALPGLLGSLPAAAQVTVLASGDPLVSGIGTTLVELLGAERVEIDPAVSSVALARARMGWSAEGCAVVSVVGRPVELALRELAPGRRVLVLSSDETTAERLAALLTACGYGKSTLHVLGNLGSDRESRHGGCAEGWAGESPRLNIVALELAGPAEAGWAPGLPDDAYEHDGQITGRDLRASALSRLQPFPGEHLWDVAAGSGSLGIEWMRSHPSCRATAVEPSAGNAERARRNAHRLGVPGLRVVNGPTRDALADLEAPDAIFIGGDATCPGVLEACLDALRPGGRIVVHAVTLETERLLATALAERGGELTRLTVENSDASGSSTGWGPARTVTQWHWTRPSS
ncbi:MAG: precorrin-6y C5,15-methyltransferase (decarboxylating) subunit CbiE [Luteococcus sp.]|uniref:precorrin-6y C5,15-methyltransferase (decarboxylating) subunit CbiE n=1 Tax=Luteococcus sp. TaxID=1969402 RepID=UPI0026492B60|nr:precorrin-6y C5,15-methyltransferase (decarboxylating) subunit CbiE [Luteococcus sp.]MDN5562611.1 precorrin-6y C5,15-methyltransferase (decarboxylating) subunit CbiE [Luteococcus sp.]